MEYSINFQDNISSQDFNNRAQGITNWIKENREKHEWAKDPNAYEMANVFLFGAKYASEGKDINLETLKEMWQIRSADFANCNISDNNFVYTICEDAYNSALNKRALVNDENSHHALRKMAGIGLYLKQQQRDGVTIQFDNLTELQTLIQTSTSLKALHPDLFEKYKFGENIEVLCSLMEKNLDDKAKQELESSKKALLHGSTPTQNRSPKVTPSTDAR